MALLLRILQQIDTFFETDMVRAWAVELITLICFFKLLLELANVFLGDGCVGLLVLYDFMVLAVGQVEELVPHLTDVVDLLLVIGVYVVLVQLEHTELLLCLHDL